MGTLTSSPGSDKALPNFLLQETIQRANGESDAVEIGSSKGKLIVLTLGITRIIEQESLDISIWASANGEDWADEPLIVFPQKFYCGTYTIMLDLSKYPDISYLKAQWKMNRWGRGKPHPLFGFYLFAQEASSDVLVSAGANE